MPEPLHPTRPGTEFELTQHLADTIGDDVTRAMDSVGWEYTQSPPVAPPVNPEGAPATSAPPAEGRKADPISVPPATVQSGPDWEQFRDQNGLILGKYKDPVAAAQGMHSLLHMAKSALSERDALRAQVESYRPPVVATTVTPSTVVAPSARSQKLEAVLAKANEGDGLDPEDLATLIEGLDEQQDLKVRQAISTVKEREQQIAREWEDVDAYMANAYPSSLRFADEMKLHLSTDPEARRVYSRLLSTEDGDAKRDATVYLWQQYALRHPEVNDSPADPARTAEEQSLQANAQVRREEVERARRDAGLLGTVAGGAHESDGGMTGPSREDIEIAGQMMKQTGDGRLWRQHTITPLLNHPLFD